jgi:hypothetical protein
MAIAPEELEGSKVLVGITRIKQDRTQTQEQFGGVATIVTQESGIKIIEVACDDGQVREYPFDVHTLERARPGQYRLRSTGQVVNDPDFLMTWIAEERLNS